MSYFNAAQLYGELKQNGESEVVEEPVNSVVMQQKKEKDSRQIQVQESGEASLKPDRVKCVITCSNVKATVEEVKQSVSQRVDYITQTLRNNNVKESQYTLHQLITPTTTTTTTGEGAHYRMDAEVVVHFHDASTFEKTTNWLVEKLKSSVAISQPVFYHSDGKLNELRRKASLNAVHNCRSKALSMAQLLNQTLGSPLFVQEDEAREFTGSHDNHDNNKHDPPQLLSSPRCSIQQSIDNATVTVSVKITAAFQCTERTKRAGK